MQEQADSLRAPTVDAAGRRRWIYPERRTGRLSRIRKRIALGLMIFYAVVPFVKIGGKPLLRFDGLEGVVYLFGQSFRSNDAFYLAFVFLALALLLGLVTSLWGRLWCGYGCPQTVFVEWLIRPIEEWIEGPAHRRRKQDAQGLSPSLFMKKLGKHLIFALITCLISHIFLAYFIELPQLWAWMQGSPAAHPLAFGVMLGTWGFLFFDLVWFREQFCAFVCPYARFQSLMIGHSTPTIAFDPKRGEPRGKKSGSGDCIDCALCVRVCPTGIDIRDGLQLECIQCGRCADACDTIMKNLKRPLGLIRNASQLELAGTREKKGFPWRSLLYASLLGANLAALSYMIGSREEVKLTLMRQPGSTFAPIGETEIANYFTLRVTNQGGEERLLQLDVKKPLRLICSLCGQKLGAQAESLGNLVIIFPRGYAAGQAQVSGPSGDLTVPLLKPE